MKFNWKIAVAIIVILAVGFWGVTSLQSRSYSGTELSFAVGGGPITVTNPTDEAIPVQLVGTGVRSFSIINASMDVTGSSTREGNGNRATQTLEFELPSGMSEFAVARGRDVTFVASAGESLEATVQPMSAEESQSTLIASTIVILLALFYISRATDHAWFKRLRSGETTKQDTESMTATRSTSQGTDMRPFGDNRAKTGD